MPLAPEDYIESFRSDVDDPLEPGDGDKPDGDCLWKDVDVLRYLNDAQVMVARKALCLRDVFTLDVAAGEALYPLPSWVLRPRSAKVTSDDRRIGLVNGEDGSCYGDDDYGRQFQIHDELSEGPVQALVFDERSDKVRAFPKPTIAETINVMVFRLPKKRIDDTDCALEIADERYERVMLLWMKKRAYEKEDADTLNKRLSEKYEKEFYAELDDLISENTKRHRRAGTVRYGGL